MGRERIKVTALVALAIQDGFVGSVNDAVGCCLPVDWLWEFQDLAAHHTRHRALGSHRTSAPARAGSESRVKR